MSAPYDTPGTSKPQHVPRPDNSIDPYALGGELPKQTPLVRPREDISEDIFKQIADEAVAELNAKEARTKRLEGMEKEHKEETSKLKPQVLSDQTTELRKMAGDK